MQYNKTAGAYVATGVYIGIYTPKISPDQVYFLCGKMTSKRLLDMSIKFYTPKKFYTPQNKFL